MAYVDQGIVPGKNSYRMKLLLEFKAMLETAQKELAELAKRLMAQPMYTMEHRGNDMFINAAKCSIAALVIQNLEHVTTASEIRQNLLDIILNQSRWANNKSTSVSSNYADDCKLSAATEALERFKHVADLEADYFGR